MVHVNKEDFLFFDGFQSLKFLHAFCHEWMRELGRPRWAQSLGEARGASSFQRANVIDEKGMVNIGAPPGVCVWMLLPLGLTGGGKAPQLPPPG